jgi:TonB family protein
MAANPAANRAVAPQAPYYRRYDLPWSPAEEMERRFRAILRNLAILFVLCALILAFLPRHEAVVNTESLPESVVQLVLEPPPPPPPPPPPKPEKPVANAPASKVPTPPVPVDPRIKASKSGLLANMDDLAKLRDQVDLDKFAKDQPNTVDPGDVSQVTRNVISAKTGGTSGGISAPTSSGLAAGSGSLKGIYTTQVKDPSLASGQGATRAGGSGKPSRSADEIALVFTRNKGAIDMMYARATRDNPALQGKVVIELTITPQGDVTAVRIVSSELNDPEFENKLKARIMLFKFEPKDVATLTATKPIDFFPAG